MASTPGFEPGSHWWEASALTTAPSLAPQESSHQSSLNLLNRDSVRKAREAYLIERGKTIEPLGMNNKDEM